MARATDEPFPVALARVGANSAKRLPVEKRIGRFLARATSSSAFVLFLHEVRVRSKEALTSPTRLLTLGHVENAAASRIDGLDPASRDLIEGCIFQLIMDGALLRLPTISRNMKPYQAIYWHEERKTIASSLHVIIDKLDSDGVVTAANVMNLLPSSLAARAQHVEMLFGHVLLLGQASTDSELGDVLDAIRRPNAIPRR